MQLTLFLIDQKDIKITINGVKIIQNFLMFASQSQDVEQQKANMKEIYEKIWPKIL